MHEHHHNCSAAVANFANGTYFVDSPHITKLYSVSLVLLLTHPQAPIAELTKLKKNGHITNLILSA
jgi:hypothetical protein